MPPTPTPSEVPPIHPDDHITRTAPALSPVRELALEVLERFALGLTDDRIAGVTKYEQTEQIAREIVPALQHLERESRFDLSLAHFSDGHSQSPSDLRLPGSPDIMTLSEPFTMRIARGTRGYDGGYRSIYNVALPDTEAGSTSPLGKAQATRWGPYQNVYPGVDVLPGEGLAEHFGTENAEAQQTYLRALRAAVGDLVAAERAQERVSAPYYPAVVVEFEPEALSTPAPLLEIERVPVRFSELTAAAMPAIEQLTNFAARLNDERINTVKSYADTNQVVAELRPILESIFQERRFRINLQMPSEDPDHPGSSDVISLWDGHGLRIARSTLADSGDLSVYSICVGETSPTPPEFGGRAECSSRRWYPEYKCIHPADDSTPFSSTLVGSDDPLTQQSFLKEVRVAVSDLAEALRLHLTR